jgi:hypothetical protein
MLLSPKLFILLRNNKYSIHISLLGKEPIMSNIMESSVFDLVIEARLVTLNLKRTSLTSATLTWDIPADYKIFAGAIVLISDTPMDPSNFPTDGLKYTASTDLSAPLSMIGNAFVVSAFYSQFGGDITQRSVDVVGLTGEKQYYASIHICSNVLQYHTAGVHSYPLDESSGALDGMNQGGSLIKTSAAPTNPKLGDVYYNVVDGKVYMWSGSTWMVASADTVPTGTDFTPNAQPGDFFYNTITKNLYVWDGQNWDKASSKEEGIPMTDKLGVGTDGSYDERANLIRVLKLQLGWPSVCVELTEEAFNVAIQNALEEFRRRADNAYRSAYVMFQIKTGQTLYYLNDPRNGTDKIVNIIKIHRVNTLGANSLGGDQGVYSQMFFNQYFSGNMVDLLSIHLISALSEDFERIFAGNLVFNFNENNRQLEIFRKLYRDEKVVMECVMERTEQELLTDRWAKQWLQSWAHAELKEMLGQIRSKYPSLPGANGGLSLNGDTLLNEARQDFEECLRQIRDFEVGNGGVEWGNTAFLIG